VDFSSRADRLHGSPEAAVLAVDTEDRAALMDSLILCKFLRGVFTDFFAESADLLRQVTGWNVSAEELQLTAQRIVNAKKLYNMREGWMPADDTLPKRFLTQPLANGYDAALTSERLGEMIQAYYKARGWDQRGGVPRALVQSLDLDDIAGDGLR
jgi:aldehyde:ferredoxin oxidoreductase